MQRHDDLLGRRKKQSENIKFYSQPVGNMTPMKDAQPAALKMNGFNWSPEKQPKSVEDLLKVKPKVITLPPSPPKKEETTRGRKN